MFFFLQIGGFTGFTKLRVLDSRLSHQLFPEMMLLLHPVHVQLYVCHSAVTSAGLSIISSSFSLQENRKRKDLSIVILQSLPGVEERMAC